ncbi:hypothetical protein CRG98_004831 [Punica granatum]|uniref:Uncharacterized protein n=1 Tax=Punica granatum TaxID=22663 RepID=A0A2I0L2G1_PUNGR|nr:hypothetical protein CRG98_004831 [Punica granatum]
MAEVVSRICRAVIGLELQDLKFRGARIVSSILFSLYSCSASTYGRKCVSEANWATWFGVPGSRNVVFIGGGVGSTVGPCSGGGVELEDARFDPLSRANSSAMLAVMLAANWLTVPSSAVMRAWSSEADDVSGTRGRGAPEDVGGGSVPEGRLNMPEVCLQESEAAEHVSGAIENEPGPEHKRKPTSLCARWPVESGVGPSEGKTGASTNPRDGRSRAPLHALGPTSRSGGPSPCLSVRLEHVLKPTPSEAPCSPRPPHESQQARNGVYFVPP